jgi:hypothetical protein
MTIETTTPGIKTPSPSDLPPAPPSKAETAAMVAALPVKSNAAATDLRSAIEQFIEHDAAGVYHRNLVEGMRAQGRQVENELRLFPRQPEEDVALYRFIACGIIDAFLGFYLPGLQRAAVAILEGAQPYDGVDELDPNKGRFLVAAADLAKLGSVLNKPAGEGQDRITLQSIDRGAFLAYLNELIQQGDKQLTTNGNHGEVQIAARLKLTAEDGSFLRKISAVGELKLGKLERQEYRMDAASAKNGSGLTLWDPKSAAAQAKKAEAEAEAKKAAKKKGGKKAEQPDAPAAASEQATPTDAPVADTAAATAA